MEVRVPSSQSLKHKQVFKGQLLKPEETVSGCMALCMSDSASLNLNFLLCKMG